MDLKKGKLFFHGCTIPVRSLCLQLLNLTSYKSYSSVGGVGFPEIPYASKNIRHINETNRNKKSVIHGPADDKRLL